MYSQTEIIKDTTKSSTEGSEGELVINVGPQHPATHGVLHLVITLEGETVKKVEPHLGYIHRSIEKMCESLSYRQFIYVTSRMDYLSAHINNHTCAMLIEKALQVEVPRRASYIRVLMDELTRIASHELWWGALAMDLGAFTPFFYAFRERETINEIMEETCGARLTMNYMVPGGVMADIHPDFVQKVRHLFHCLKARLMNMTSWLPAILFSKPYKRRRLSFKGRRDIFWVHGPCWKRQRGKL
jgi:NADH-quinone oxidoreductase subunit D/NADH-quinone oxidoreductase subunit C/D